MNKKKETIKIACISIGITLFIYAAIIFMIYQGESIRQEYTTTEISEYGNWDGHIDMEREALESGLFLFPKEISSAANTDYMYYCATDYHSINRYLIYLEATYSDEDYQKEVERIANTKCEVQLDADGTRVTNDVMSFEDLFAYPAYAAIYGSNLSYEYALAG